MFDRASVHQDETLELVETHPVALLQNLFQA